MGEHRTASSLAAIGAIAELAESLGYDVRCEWPIPGTGSNPEKIDIALFIDDRATLPALAIEVDSSDAAASTSNAVKIFGKTTSSLIKPFFVFHVFMSPTKDGNKRSNIETAFSTQNYRTYDFSQANDKQSFVRDLIDCHRAIDATVDLYQFGMALDGGNWSGINRCDVLEKAATELDSDGHSLRDIAALSVDAESLDKAIVQFARNAESYSFDRYALSFTGRMFCWPLLCGLKANEGSQRRRVFAEFKQWQDDPVEIIFHSRNSYLGLSSEFDYAISEIAPLVFSVVAMFFGRDTPESGELCEQLYARATAADGLGPEWSKYALSWCALASIAVNAIATAEKSLAEISRLGGVPTNAFPYLSGPDFYDQENSTWLELLTESVPLSTPTVAGLREAIESLPPPTIAITQLVAKLLVDDEFLFTANEQIIRIASSLVKGRSAQRPAAL